MKDLHWKEYLNLISPNLKAKIHIFATFGLRSACLIFHPDIHYSFYDFSTKPIFQLSRVIDQNRDHFVWFSRIILCIPKKCKYSKCVVFFSTLAWTTTLLGSFAFSTFYPSNSVAQAGVSVLDHIIMSSLFSLGVCSVGVQKLKHRATTENRITLPVANKSASWKSGADAYVREWAWKVIHTSFFFAASIRLGNLVKQVDKQMP